MSIHYNLTDYGFEFGEAAVTRSFSHKGYVGLRIASRSTGKFVDIQLSPKGRTFYISPVRKFPKKVRIKGYNASP